MAAPGSGKRTAVPGHDTGITSAAGATLHSRVRPEKAAYLASGAGIRSALDDMACANKSCGESVCLHCALISGAS